MNTPKENDMAEKNEENWRDRLEKKRDQDREQIEGFFDSRRGRIFIYGALGLFALAVIWNVLEPIVKNIFGGGGS